MEDEELQRILRSAGIESAPVDPSSMEALRQFVRDRKEAGEHATSSMTAAEAAAAPPPPPPSSSSSVSSSSENKNTGQQQQQQQQRQRHQEIDAVNRLVNNANRSRASNLHTTLRRRTSTSDLTQSGAAGPDGASATSSNVQTTTTTTVSEVVGKKDEQQQQQQQQAARSSSSSDTTYHNTKLLELLEFQTTLLLDTQRKLDTLTAKVDLLEGHLVLVGRGVDDAEDDEENSLKPSVRSYVAQRQVTRVYSERTGTELPRNHRLQRARQTETSDEDGLHNNVRDLAAEGNHDHQQAVQQQQPQQPPPQGLHQRVIRTMQEFSMIRILRLFWSQSRTYVRPLDGGLLFKLVFMMLVMSARMSQNPGAADAGRRMYITLGLMVSGFLYHTKYLQFLHKFVWVDTVPWRVIRGERIEGEEGYEPPPPPPPPPAAAANQAGEPRNHPPPPLQQQPQALFRGNIPVPPNRRRPPEADAQPVWEPHFLFGAIAAGDPQQNMVVRVVQEVLFLVGSFVFSIFPMWRPEGPPPPPPPPPTPVAEERPPAAAGMQDIPVVAPPRNAMEPADDDSDGEDDDDDEE